MRIELLKHQAEAAAGDDNDTVGDWIAAVANEELNHE